jgi:hypothetical protein
MQSLRYCGINYYVGSKETRMSFLSHTFIGWNLQIMSSGHISDWFWP